MRKITYLAAFLSLIIFSCVDENANTFDSAAELERQLDSARISQAAELKWHLDSAKIVQDSIAALLKDSTSEFSSARIMTYEPNFSYYPLRLIHRRDNSSNNIDSEYANSSLSWNANGQLINDQTKAGNVASGVEGVVGVTLFSTTMYTFHTGAGDTDARIYITWSSDGTNWYSSVYNSWETQSKMGATQFSNELLLFWYDDNAYGKVAWGDFSGNYFGHIPNVYANLSADQSRYSVDAVEYNGELFVFYPYGSYMKYVQANLPLNGSSTTWNYYQKSGIAHYGYEPIVFNGYIYLFYFDAFSNIWYIRSNNPTNVSSWSSPVTVLNKSTHKPLSATVFEGQLILTWMDNSNNNKDIRWASTSDGTSWTDRGITGYRSKESPAIIAFPDYDENYALNASVSASSTFPGYGYSASNVIDGRTNTDLSGNESWSNTYPTSGGTLPQYVTLDFGTSKNISKVQLYTSSGYALRDFAIETSNNGIQFTSVVGPDLPVIGNVATRVERSFTPQSVRYLRIRCNSGPNHQPEYVRINELEVY